jgi:ribosomal protein S12 methylthiotransferase accessory factor YcaO
MNSNEFRLRYQLRLVKTESGTGYFACFPDTALDFDACLPYARAHPNDEFMRRHLLRQINGWERHRLRRAIAAVVSSDIFLRALFFEACLLNQKFAPLRALFVPGTVKKLAAATPLVFIGTTVLGDRKRHQEWIRLFRRNILHHVELPAPEEANLPPPFADRSISTAGTVKQTLKQLCDALPTGAVGVDATFPDAGEVAARALERLRLSGIAAEPEMRHAASLSPIALQRRWEVKTTVVCGRHDYSFRGEQTAYGRGLDLESARAACVMEIVERCSAYASVAPGEATGYRMPHRLLRASASDLERQGVAYLDPNRLALEAPYRDAPLYWLEGEEPHGDGSRTVLVPAQCVFLFCNLDEVKLFSALGSTGLAAGCTIAAAKTSALLEVIERDSESVMPYTHKRCFEIETRDPAVEALVDGYQRLGIRIQFLDITTPIGVPCCKCFVVSADGRIVKGTGAHLNARRALLAALTETPYPYPGGPPTLAPQKGLLRVPLEKLPDYSTGAAAGDLRLIETLLAANGFRPVYVDLTRNDLGIPVVRAIVPGMELLGDLDRFARVNPRLYAHYLRLFCGAH